MQFKYLLCMSRCWTMVFMPRYQIHHMHANIVVCGLQLADDRFDMLVHSPLARAVQTAEIVWGKRKGPVHILPSLREIDLYSFQVTALACTLATACLHNLFHVKPVLALCCCERLSCTHIRCQLDIPHWRKDACMSSANITMKLSLL